MTGNGDTPRKTDPTQYRVAVDGARGAGARHFAPAAERNQGPILEVLKAFLPERGCALEIASGSGQHAIAFAEAFPSIDWMPSDPVPDAQESITAWTQVSGLENIRAPLALDMLDENWADHVVAERIEAVIAINLLHISPWEATHGFFRGAGQLLGTNGIVYIYGPFKRGGHHTAESNASFDDWLKERNSAWGVRALEDVTAEAERHGFALSESVAMPANNFSLIYRKTVER